MSTKKAKIINPKYVFPDYYDRQYFFTIQKPIESRRKQMGMWINLIVKYCQDNKVWRLNKLDFKENLGKNAKVNRQLNDEAINMIFTSMVAEKKAIFVTNDEILILWKSLNEWGQFIYSAAMTRGSIEKLETLEYISQDEDNRKEEYYLMDIELLIKILRDLENQGKCGLIKDSENNYIAVKFYRTN